MARMTRPRLRAAEPLARHAMRLTFCDGTVHVLNFTPLIAESVGLAPLRDEAVFATGGIIEGEGWAVVWPEPDIQIGADTLWLDALAQNAPDENARIFAEWRARNGLSLAEAAKALGMSARTINAYGRGVRPIPRYVVLACKGWDAERNPSRR
jgi:hypothetical protein